MKKSYISNENIVKSYFYGYTLGSKDYDPMGIGYEREGAILTSQRQSDSVSRVNVDPETFPAWWKTDISLLEYSLLGYSSFNIFKDKEEYLENHKERLDSIRNLALRGI